MTCDICNGEMVMKEKDGALEYWVHRETGGRCPENDSQAPHFLDGMFTLEEAEALKRVAQAQIEMEKRRGSRL